MRRRIPSLLVILLLSVHFGCAQSERPPPSGVSIGGVNRAKAELAVRDYLFWTYSARYIEKLELTYSAPEDADGKATDLVVHADYAFSHRDARRSQALQRGQERLRLQKTDYGYRVLELNRPSNL